jgi:hypothetical protein
MKQHISRFAAVLSGITLSLAAYAQILDNSEGQAFTEYPFFNSKFIRQAGIREFRGTYTFKKQNDIMRKTDYVYVFSFDSLGNLSQHYETAKGDIVNDTLVRLYTYDSFNRLLSLRTSEKSGFFSRYFTYDDEGRIVKEETWRDIDTLHSILKPVIERSILWNTETMEYERTAEREIKRVFNGYGIQYLEISRYKDSLGFLDRIEELYTVTRDRDVTDFTYGKHGWVENIKVLHNLNPVPVTEMQFEYDKHGNLSSKRLYRNGVFTTEYQIIYSERTGMLSSILIREVSTNFISMIRFAEPSFRK